MLIKVFSPVNHFYEPTGLGYTIQRKCSTISQSPINIDMCSHWADIIGSKVLIQMNYDRKSRVWLRFNVGQRIMIDNLYIVIFTDVFHRWLVVYVDVDLY